MINRDREKLLNLIVYFVKNTKKCHKTKLFKLLYFADFLHFKETGKSITGQVYEAWKHGPVPCELYYEFKKPKDDLKAQIDVCGAVDNWKFVVKKKFDDIYFTKRELKIIERVAYIFREADADLMVDSSHLKNEPWKKTIDSKGQGAQIDYALALDGSKNSISTSDYEELRKEINTFEKIFT